jgi:phospholipid transport system transporter-binding protein
MLVLPPTLTEREARDTLSMLSQALQREKDVPVVVDASGLSRFDSSALAVLLECQRLARAWGRAFEVRNPPAKLLSLAGLYGVDTLLLPGKTPAAAR